jgi:hypothetical protein
MEIKEHEGKSKYKKLIVLGKGSYGIIRGIA